MDGARNRPLLSTLRQHDARYPIRFVSRGPGAWDLITIGGARALRDADVILTDHLGLPKHFAEIIGPDDPTV